MAKVSGELIRIYSSVKDGLVYRTLYVYKQKKHFRAILYASTCIGWKNKSHIIGDISVNRMFPQNGINEEEIKFIFTLLKINMNEYECHKMAIRCNE